MTTFRLDRFLTLFFFHPLQKIGISTGESRIPILMYHSLSRTKMKVGHPYYEIATAPHIFEAHMKFIHQNDYQVIDLGDILAYFAGNFKLTQKPIVISFDDGFKDFYTEAFPILRQYGFPASMFLPTRFIGNNGLTFNGKECLSWDIVRDLNGNGITFGSHTMNHLELYRMQEDEIDYEIKNSKERIDKEVGEPIVSFSYPYSFPDQDQKFIQRLKEILIRNGYSIGVTTRIGMASKKDDRFFLKRLPANTFDDLRLFKAKLEGAYDWVFHFQLAYKKLKPYFNRQRSI